MKIRRLDIAELIADRIDRQPSSAQHLSREVAAYLLDNQRTADVESLLRDIRFIRAERGIVEVIAVSAHPLDESEQRAIKNQVQELYPSAKQIIITEQHDESVLGGVRLELPDRQLDATIRGKLNRFKQLTAGE